MLPPGGGIVFYMEAELNHICAEAADKSSWSHRYPCMEAFPFSHTNFSNV